MFNSLEKGLLPIKIFQMCRAEGSYNKPSCCLQALPAWDEVTISEAGDSVDSVTSTISVLALPSLPLVTLLLELSTSIHCQHPTSLPASLLSWANMMWLDAILCIQFHENLASQTLTLTLESHDRICSQKSFVGIIKSSQLQSAMIILSQLLFLKNLAL